MDHAPTPPSTTQAVLQPTLALCLAEYQPLIPARGLVPDQWQQRLRLRATPTQAGGVLRADVAEAARHAGTLATLDRLALQLALSAVGKYREAGRNVRIQVEVDLSTLIDPGFLTHYG